MTKFRILCLFICCVAFANSAAQKGRVDWRFYGHDPGGMRYSELKQVNRSNVARLQRAWIYHTGEIKRLPNVSPDTEPPAFECTPIVVNNLLYFSTPSGRVIALDAETGAQVWEFDSQSGTTPRKYHQHRGVSYWEGSHSGRRDLDRRILFGTFDGRLIALNSDTGKPCPDFGKDGAVDLRKGAADEWPDALYAVSSPPAIYKNLLITGARLPERPSSGPSGVVRAFDVQTGRLIWSFHTVPQPGEAGHETWEGDSWKNRTGANVWSIISVDTERGLIFLPIGSPADDFYGDDRKGKNLFGNSLVALDANSGKLIWYYQMVHHDLWDYDLPAQPNLVTLRRGSRSIPAVVEVTKMGLVFVLDRLTGRPMFPVEERTVPRPADPHRYVWATQPFPVKPSPLSRLSLTAGDLSSVTPESKQYCSELFKSVVGGKIFAPIGCDPTLFLPGTLGGATWSGASFDPSTGYLYVNVNEVPIVAALDCAENRSVTPPAVRKLQKYVRFTDQNGWPCLQPPWGTLNAIDLSSGEIVWRVPLGAVDELTARGVPKTGVKNLGGSIVTAGGLVFIGATVDSRFRAFDSRSGQELWSAPVDAPAHATPVTYLGKSGRQFVVIAAGGGGYFSADKLADSLIAYALPK